MESSSKSPGNDAGKSHIAIRGERCKGCYLCVEACPRDQIVIGDCLNEGGYYPAVVKEDAVCTACGLCWQVCPDCAIEVFREKKESAQ